jgi:hypothetical protein
MKYFLNTGSLLQRLFEFLLVHPVLSEAKRLFGTYQQQNNGPTKEDY